VVEPVDRADLVYLFVSDMDRAVAFYRDTLGLSLEYRAGDDWAQFEAGPIKLGLHGAASGEVRAGGTVAFTVQDLDASRAGLAADGVSLGHEGGGEGGEPRFVEFTDPDGNALALFEYARTER
jgi:catechol 2,3-dioxygenase-like lactoylglutathione lyase family enzyme